MAEISSQQGNQINLQKLGIREIQERLEVSPIITDPGTFDVNVDDPGGKTYNCNIVVGKPNDWDY